MDVERVLKENNITPRKEYDQYFLKDERMLQKEASLANLGKDDVVLEIGAGPGNLTEHIAKKCKVIAIEKDYAFRGLLKQIPDTNVIFGNALEILESLRLAREKGKPPQFNKVVSNIPYSISQDMLVELLRHPWSAAVLAVQKEFADKLKDKKERISIAVNDCCILSRAGKIPAGAFYPPAAESSIIVLRQKQLLDYGFWQFLGEAFRNRNKNAGKALKISGTGALKKVHQLTMKELKEAYKLFRKV